MKKLLIYILILNSLFALSQTERDTIIMDVENSIKAYNESDFETLLNYTPKFIFRYISKEELIKGYSEKHKPKNIDVNEINIDTIMTIDSVKYVRFYLKSEIATYGIKTKKNWTFIELSEMFEKYLPIEIRQTEKK
ncbi:hypothetical protein [Psychroserpens mesophilus]|uniref:hypothetical protein n=1 Tax=Psychroserpens mesophilus TaxID=325473 RepID=UPI00126A35BC|nr:hypothetical protein [Psychroserpens mesophilus]